jgi:hypothetical protein
MLTKQQLVEAMLYELGAFKPGAALNEQTRHNEVLSPDSDFGPSNPMRLYEGAVRSTLVMNGGKDKAFPKCWLTMTVGELADYLLKDAP